MRGAGVHESGLLGISPELGQQAISCLLPCVSFASSSDSIINFPFSSFVLDLNMYIFIKMLNMKINLSFNHIALFIGQVLYI